MQQRKLSFSRITADDAAQQRVRVAEAVAAERLQRPAPPPLPPKRAPGRPPKKRQLQDELIPASSSSAAESARAADAASSSPMPPTKRANTNWFSSPYIRDVMAAYGRHGGSAKRAVAALKREAVYGRYETLSDSTVRSWFGPGKTLLPRFQAQLDAGVAASRGGRPGSLPAAVEDEVKLTLQKLRDTGAPLSSHVIRWTLQAVFRERDAALLDSLQLSQQWISQWVRSQLNWRWRARTTAASKLPHDWEEQGVLMAKRIAAAMEMHSVHPSLVINMDQTGVHLVPASSWTYERQGSSTVAVVGAEDKRQITACLGSSLHGDLLPLQLIFAGKTARVLPEETAASKAARVHLTFSDNHWSSLITMQQWVTKLLLPYAERCIQQFELNSNAHILLVLDCWAVHKSEEFRRWLRTQHPRIHLVFVPANCTSKLQVADVTLQRPFKATIRRCFEQWAAEEMRKQIASNEIVGFGGVFKMATLKPLVLGWCTDSWQELQQRKDVVAQGWYKCVLNLYDVCEPAKRVAALAAVAKQELDAAAVPDAEESAPESDSESSSVESDLEPDELDTVLPRAEPERRSTRARKQSAPHGYMLDSSQIVMTEDSEA